MNGENEYCFIMRFTWGNANPTKKFPDQLATLIADIITGLGPTSVNSITNNINNIKLKCTYYTYKLIISFIIKIKLSITKKSEY